VAVDCLGRAGDGGLLRWRLANPERRDEVLGAWMTFEKAGRILDVAIVCRIKVVVFTDIAGQAKYVFHLAFVGAHHLLRSVG